MMVNDNALFQKNAALLNPSLASQLLQKSPEPKWTRD